MNIARTLAATALLLICASSHAARPTSIVFETLAETKEGTPYARFSVKCDDGRSVPLTAWDGRRKWCLGDSGSGGCEKRQISAAKTACMTSATSAHPTQEERTFAYSR